MEVGISAASASCSSKLVENLKLKTENLLLLVVHGGQGAPLLHAHCERVQPVERGGGELPALGGRYLGECIISHHPDNIHYIQTWEYPTGQAVTSGATVVLIVVVVVVGATVVVVVVAVVARQVDGAAAAQVIGEQVPPKIPHWTVHWAEPVQNQK